MKVVVIAAAPFAVLALALTSMPAANADEATAPGQAVINLGHCRSVVAKTQPAGFNRYWAPGQIGVFALVLNANGEWVIAGPEDALGRWGCGK